MPSKKIFYYAVQTVSSLLALAVLILAALNLQPVPFNCFGSTLQLSLGGTIIGAYIIGLSGTILVWQAKISEVRSEKKLQQWDVQDQKLAKEVASDAVKLLEAKVATLEVALTKALERKKSV